MSSRFVFIVLSICSCLHFQVELNATPVVDAVKMSDVEIYEFQSCRFDSTQPAIVRYPDDDFLVFYSIWNVEQRILYAELDIGRLDPSKIVRDYQLYATLTDRARVVDGTQSIPLSQRIEFNVVGINSLTGRLIISFDRFLEPQQTYYLTLVSAGDFTVPEAFCLGLRAGAFWGVITPNGVDADSSGGGSSDGNFPGGEQTQVPLSPEGSGISQSGASSNLIPLLPTAASQSGARASGCGVLTMEFDSSAQGTLLLEMLFTFAFLMFALKRNEDSRSS